MIEVIKYPEIGAEYKHYKGGIYRVITMAKHSETEETVVVYQSILFGSYYVRPLKMWFDKIQFEGVAETQRFTKINGND